MKWFQSKSFNGREVNFLGEKSKGLVENECGCWDYETSHSDGAKEIICRVTCCLASPDNCHNGTGTVTCKEHCK